MSLSEKQRERNREKHAENIARRKAGLPPLNRRHGQPRKDFARANVCRRVIGGREVFDSNVRNGDYKRTFCGRYFTHAEAVAAAEHYIATGARPVRQRAERKAYVRRAKTAPVAVQRNVRDGAARWAAVYRERLAA